MQNTVNTRTNRYGIDLSAIKPYPANKSYIPQVIKHLQDTKQNLSTKDLVALFLDDIKETARALYYDNFETALVAHVSPQPHGLLRAGDTLDLYVLMRNYLSAVQTSDKYYQNLLVINTDLPSKSTINPKKLAVWRNTSKMSSLDTRQAVSVRKWIGSTLIGLDSEQQEALAKLIDTHLQGDMLDNLDIRFAPSSAFQMWRDAYESDKIRSCMHPSSNCEVGQKRTYTTYCTAHHGLPDNGLQLAILYQDDTPVARAITFTDDEDNQKCFIRSYGDGRLAQWLQEHGYKQADFKAGTILYTTDDLLKPYIDGDTHMAVHHTTDKGINYWVLTCYGDYDLQTTNAYAYRPIECECCGDNYPDEYTYELLSAVNGRWYTVCEDCADNNRYYVYTGSQYAELVFFHDGYAPTTNSGYVEYDNEYYEVESLHQYDLQMVDDEVYHYDDMYYCEVTDRYFVSSDDVITDAEQISTSQPVHFPYNCVSREYWYANVVECACGTLALREDTRKLSKPSLGEVVTLHDYWSVLNRRDGAGVEVVGIIFKLADIERDYLYDPTDKMKAFRDYAIAYNKIQYLRFQELGI